MTGESHCRYYIVDETALPEVCLRTTQARELLDTGRAQTVAEAARRAGITSEAYYTYKNAVLPFRDMRCGRVVTFQLTLRHRTGVLSAVLGLFSGAGANILTIHQGLPTDGTAPVTITAETADMDLSAGALLERLGAAEGVVGAAVVAG